MNRLTVDERRRANELRRLSTTLGAPRALAVEELGERTGAGWGRNARLATLITVILGGVLALLQLAHDVFPATGVREEQVEAVEEGATALQRANGKWELVGVGSA